MQQSNHSKTKITLAILTLLLLACIGFAIVKSMSFHIVRTVPSTNSISTITPEISIQFNETLSNSFKVSSPNNVVNKYQINGKDVNILLNLPLNPAQLYKINLSGIRSISGKNMPKQTLLFKPKLVTGKKLTQSQTKVLLNQQQQYSNSIYGNPLLQLLPFTGPNFEYSIDYTVSNDNSGNPFPVILITSASTQGQKDALAWLASLGYSPSNLDIQMITGQP